MKATFSFFSFGDPGGRKVRRLPEVPNLDSGASRCVGAAYPTDANGLPGAILGGAALARACAGRVLRPRA